MKAYLRKTISLVLCLALCMGLYVPAFAANENNTRGVTFGVTLDTPTITTSTEEQTVVMRLKSSGEITMCGMGMTITNDSPLELSGIAGGEDRIVVTPMHYNMDNGKIGWGTDDAEDISGVTDMLTVTFTVPANTPAGTYNVGVNELELCDNYGDIWEKAASATTTLTITDAPVGYTASLTALTSEVSVDDAVAIYVGVSHSTDVSFSAGEVMLRYDNTKLSFNQNASTLGAATVKDNAGTLTLEDYGAEKSFDTGVYVLVFDAIADGETAVTMTSAAFVNKTDAAKSDLVAATIAPEAVNLTIQKKTYSVTLPDIFTGPATVEDGASYTFTVTDGANYNYGPVTATVNGINVNVVDNGDGTYTVENVTGNLIIYGTRTEKTYSVTFEGNAAGEITDGNATATYNTDYSFTMPSAAGWAYSMDSITIGGTAYTGYSVDGSVYTIPGSAIRGNIVITVSKVATEASVTVVGSGAGAAAGYEVKVDIGADYTLTIVPESGYAYTVTATMGGTPATVIDNGNNSYTIKNVTGDIIFTVERTVVVDGVTVTEYLTLDGSVMWLIKNETTLADGKVPTYAGENMFWSEKYGAYCYLAIAETLSTEEAAAKVNITDGAAVTVDYGMDVNKTGKVDASDAQLTYNMYNAEYVSFTAEVSVEKFLRADVNGDGKVNVEDATAIIASILA